MACARSELPEFPAAPSGCRLLFSSHSKYERDWQSYRHTHRFAELFYVCAGNGSFCVEDNSFPIARHTVILVNPNIVHTEISSQNSPLEYISLGVEDLHFAFEADRE